MGSFKGWGCGLSTIPGAAVVRPAMMFARACDKPCSNADRNDSSVVGIRADAARVSLKNFTTRFAACGETTRSLTGATRTT
jgi:hypothetical protein